MNAEQAVTWLIGQAAEREGWKIVDGVVMKPCPGCCGCDECVHIPPHQPPGKSYVCYDECHGTGLVPAGGKP